MIILSNGKSMSTGTFKEPESLNASIARVDKEIFDRIASIGKQSFSDEKFYVTYYNTEDENDYKFMLFNIETEMGRKYSSTNVWFVPLSKFNQVINDPALIVEMVEAKVYGNDGYKIIAIGRKWLSKYETIDEISFKDFLAKYETYSGKEYTSSHLLVENDLLVTNKPDTFNGSNYLTAIRTVSQYFGSGNPETPATQSSPGVYTYELAEVVNAVNMTGPYEITDYEKQLDLVASLDKNCNLIISVDGNYFTAESYDEVTGHLFDICKAKNHNVQIGLAEDVALSGNKFTITFEV